METNKINNSSVNNTSFAGTILENSYVPFFIESMSQNRDLDLIDGTSLEKGFADIDINSIIAPCISESVLGKVFEGLLGIFFSSTKSEEELKSLKLELNKFIETSKANFDRYSSLHESCLNNIVSDIDTINRNKTLMKDYLLNNLFTRLKNMGVECSFSDFIVEHIDLRNFPINDNYNLVQKENLSTVQIFDTYLDELTMYPIICKPTPLFPGWSKRREIKKLNQQLRDLNRKEQYNTAMMNADIQLISKLESALCNIACIYKDVMKVLMPIMEKLLDELSHKYNNSISQMPIVKVQTLRNIKDILKDLSEVRIVPNKSSIENMEDQVVKYSNSLSKKHNKLKSEILNVA